MAPRARPPAQQLPGGEEASQTQPATSNATSATSDVQPATPITPEAQQANAAATAMQGDRLTDAELDARIALARATMLRRKKAEYLAILERGEIPPFSLESLEPPRQQTASNGDEERMHKRARSEAWGRLQLPTLKYRGKNWSELQTFLTGLQSHFAAQPEIFEEDIRKVVYATSCFDADMPRRWTNYLQVERGGVIQAVTWPELREWMQSGISDGPTRCLEATSKLSSIAQGPYQRFQHFLDYFEQIEGELPEPLPDSFRICYLIQRLRPAVRTQVLSNGVPATWQELRQSGVIAESLMFQNGATPSRMRDNTARSPPNRGSEEASSTPKTETGASSPPSNARSSSEPSLYARSPDGSSRPPRSVYAGRTTVTCYSCGQLGHISPNCPKKQNPATGVNLINDNHVEEVK